MKICIYGAGAIGGWLGARLAPHTGAPLAVVARGATLAALREHGLRLTSPDGDIHTPVQASDDPAVLGVQDLVIVAVKAPALTEVARRIGPLIGPGTTVLTAMNGVPWWFLDGFGGVLQGTRLRSVDPDGAIAQAIPTARVVGCVVHASCSLDGPGAARHNPGGRKVIIGEPSGHITPRVQALSALLAQGGIEAPVSEQIQRDVWFKLWGNMTMNPVSALTGATIDRILDDDLVHQFTTRVMCEAREIGARIGIPIAEDPEDRQQVSRKLGAVRTSMLQDVEAGRPVELDALVGSVRELGQLTGVATPFTDALLGLARLKARVLGLY
ncbi:2-dehydropantoate 2-reductase [Ramlibacter sp. H39-3-26]|uniref:2-dehydropantoate 2-reductase n=1 Tax=Curvibacter soli TaxID=3031331 RepID=UPI0023DA2C29|nr:2-dehydropantoate 2-reductase [Ramlibacter sp. H39-3-26]MDF1486071.1 2-dehydropantoate 2-reductase [Ramlibacter sp. H39-3-26]